MFRERLREFFISFIPFSTKVQYLKLGICKYGMPGVHIQCHFNCKDSIYYFNSKDKVFI